MHNQKHKDQSTAKDNAPAIFRPSIMPTYPLPKPPPFQNPTEGVKFDPIATPNNIVPITSELIKYRYQSLEERMTSSFGIVLSQYNRFTPVFPEDLQSYPRNITVVYVPLPGLDVEHPFAITKAKRGVYSPDKEYLAAIKACFTFFPAYDKKQVEHFDDKLREYMDAKDRARFLTLASEINHIFKNTPPTKPLVKVVDYVIDRAYGACVSPCLRTLLNYAAFSEKTYGEFLPAFIWEVLTLVSITPASVVVDLGCGVGQLVMQIVLATSCTGYGIEVRKDLFGITQDLIQQTLLHAQLWGLAPGGMKVYTGDITSDVRTPGLLQLADLVIVNNKMFTPDQKKLKEGMVSWDGKAGSYFVYKRMSDSESVREAALMKTQKAQNKPTLQQHQTIITRTKRQKAKAGTEKRSTKGRK
ncbi:Nucleosomal histone H3-Lys79 methylase [Marasmius crinis-equi]|uniref:Histone-lysine N-methyltransferase, H3 lysine-79 specific n=1 Tax=Marasmius crinis-equi TaxID=585013 RepID=A0ABR3FRA1_9AGAR